ncbi:Transporter [Sphingomonas aurantiaca]|mgnify:CR=1 FL=1|jgi:cobalt-zinc-cadmium efflux system outer membrane protein|uniref:Transporter n=2 Tax=Sphingomonas TaxID=13687 RepID=A0A5E7XYP2_9SPHN|nr:MULTISPECIES: TolC family protein [Sphingomonas]MCP8891416.1 TolC family protein [Sphingomonas faeni]VVS99364.1 Transporter [Sphingomonas aurantiaca]VXC99685.1 Heavy metal RND efflux outer membrane protein, CzcC family [Sphingomonas sp. T1]
MRASMMLAVAVLSASTAQAQSLTYDQAIRGAVANAPGAAAARAGVSAAQAEAGAAGSLPDPRLSIGVDNYPISGPPAFSLTRDDMTMGRVGFQQDLPNLAKRHAAQAQARAAIVTAQASQEVKFRQVRLGAGQAWMDLAYTERRLAALDAIIRSLRTLPSAARTAVASGTARPAQSLGINQAIAGLEDRRDELVAAVARARAMLARWTGVPAPEIAGDVPVIDLVPAKLRTALEQHPDMVSADASIHRAQADVDAARAEKRPDWGAEVAYQRRDPRYGDMVSAGVSMSLPLFARSRQDPRIAARRSAQAQAEAQREETRRTLAAGLDAALADHEMHHSQWQRALRVLLPLARERADLETASYAAGRANLTDIIDAKTALADAELTALDREADVASDAVRLTITFGSDDR